MPLAGPQTAPDAPAVPAQTAPGPDPVELARLRQAVDASGEVVFMTGLDGVFTFVNPQFERTYGYRAADVIGRVTPRILKGGSLAPGDYEQLWRSLGAGDTVRSEFINRTKDGAMLAVEATITPIWEDGRIVGFLAIQRDITGRKAAESALRDREATLRLIADYVSDMVSQVRLDGTYIYASPAHQRVLGYAPQDLLGTSAFALVHPEDLDRVRAEVETGIRARVPSRFVFRCRHAAGHYLWLEAAGTLLFDERGTPSSAVLSSRDISERRQLEEDFRHAQKMEAVGRLAGGIAHDFNNVLTAILGYSEMLLDDLQDRPEIRADLEEIRAAGVRASRLTRQLLTFSRKQIVTTEVFDLNEVVTAVEAMTRRVIGEDVSSTLALSPQPVPIAADRGQVEQVIMNLVVNARDAMPKGGQLTVSTQPIEVGTGGLPAHRGLGPGAHVALSVADTGHGMPPEVLDHVFEPFFTTKPVGKGTGLGLATVYAIVRDAGGRVAIESHPGAGTTVTAFFPKAALSLAAGAGEAHSHEVRGGGETILIAEDEAPVRELMAKTLRRLGYRVLVADGATRALQIEATCGEPIHLLVSDVVMPGLSGPDLVQRLVRRRPELQVLYVSGFASHFALRLASTSRHTAFLAKPFGPDLLAQTARALLDRAGHPAANAT